MKFEVIHSGRCVIDECPNQAGEGLVLCDPHLLEWQRICRERWARKADTRSRLRKIWDRVVEALRW